MDTLAVQLYISHYLGMFRTFTCESAPMAHIKKLPVRFSSDRQFFKLENSDYMPKYSLISFILAI